jgi:hypothetical protein
MVVHKVEKSIGFMLLQAYWDIEFQASNKSFQFFFNIYIW